MQVDIVNLRKYFGKTKAVDDISFSFGTGQIFGFVGPNGAGKTTAIRIIATLLDPMDGDVLIDGLSVVEEPEKSRHLLGYMPDSLPTHSDMTVHDYLDFFARAYGINSKRRHSVVEEVEQFANLMGIRDKFLK
ncbi:MAG: ABC transporter ATP-binding protein, partial [Planctomycetes bacterium]|nr:ABC transporter ATP-binding protein [Planctomycetota bacterium]